MPEHQILQRLAAIDAELKRIAALLGETGYAEISAENVRAFLLPREKLNVPDSVQRKMFDSFNGIFAEEYIEHLLQLRIRVQDIPQWLLRDSSHCPQIYITAFRADRAATREQYQEDLDFLKSEIEAARNCGDIWLAEVLARTYDNTKWGIQYFDWKEKQTFESPCCTNENDPA